MTSTFRHTSMPGFATIAMLLFTMAACTKAPEESTGSPMTNMPPPEVTVMTVEPHMIPVSYEYIGQTVGSREVEVRARVTGHVEQRLYAEGELVQAGQPLFQLDARPLVLTVATAQAAITTAEADIARAEASAVQARRERDRLAPLAEARAISRKDADDAASAEQVASAEAQAARARLEQARAQLREAQLNLEYASILAPISGIAGRALRQEGSLVNPNTDSLLTTLVQLDPLYASFNVADAERSRLDHEIAAGALVLPKSGFSVRLLQRDGMTLAQGGRVNYVSPTVSNQTGTLEMRAQFANPGSHIKSGLFVRVLLEGAHRPNALTVPQRAVLEGPKGKTVMRVVKNRGGALVAESCPLEVGEWVTEDGEKSWVVKSGLQAGDQIIVDGLMKLRPGTEIRLGQANATAPGATTEQK
jgi:membrane fusion protein (multidrug efflux system)